MFRKCWRADILSEGAHAYSRTRKFRKKKENNRIEDFYKKINHMTEVLHGFPFRENDGTIT
jgi:hypothetical protein